MLSGRVRKARWEQLSLNIQFSLEFSKVHRRQLHFIDLNHLCHRSCTVILAIQTHRLVTQVEGGLQKGTLCFTQAIPTFPTAQQGIHQDLQSNSARQFLLFLVSRSKNCEMAVETDDQKNHLGSFSFCWLARSQCRLAYSLRYLKMNINQSCCLAGISLLKDDFLAYSESF